MRRSIQFLCSALVLIAVAGPRPAQAKVVGRTVEYSADSTSMRGYLAYDDAAKGPRPGILVVHEWWGLNDYARNRARMLAGLGYVALALDMYGEGKNTTHPEDAGKFSSEMMNNFPEARARFLAAEDLLKQQPNVDPERIGAIGYCFGGGIVLNMARQGADLKGVASFHGALAAVTPAEAGSVKAKIIVFAGADDKFVPASQVEAFRAEMNAAKADFQIITYPGASHSFTNPDATEIGKKYNLPLAYNAEADRKSWEAMKKFFKSVFKS
jgi:dienelactone hydrolase